ncbi:MAG: RDD family protein [Saprospiraceae bacterium]|nr:RDD family protein [Saprospiraceae bacterium]
MKTIDIATAHNIVVTQELAGIIQRITAFALDALIIGTYAALIGLIFSSIEAMIYVAIGLVILLYHLIWEIYNNGQSPGKRLMHLRVVSIKGIRPSLQDYLLRWAFRLIDITFSIGTIGILSIVTSSKAQRIGDLLGRTAVINLRSSRQVDLKSLEQLSHQRKEIQYPEVVRYSDTDMLLIKQALQRYQRDQNRANTIFILDLSQKVRTDLSISANSADPLNFLKQILADYIILTR